MDNKIREKLVELIGKIIEPLVFVKFFVNYLMENGVTVLPCKLGDTVWGIRKCNLGNAVKQGVVYQMYFSEKMRLCICVKNVCRGEWGVNVFATQAEAEEALRRKGVSEDG